MKSVSLLLTMLLSLNFLHAQNKVVTKVGSLNIAKEVKPPVLTVTDISFEDATGNNAIDANEFCNILLSLRNDGFGDGMGLKGTIKASGATSGITFSNISIPDIPVGNSCIVKFPVKSSMNTVDGKVEFAVAVQEPMGFGTDDQFISVNTNKFISPMIQVVDYAVTGSGASGVIKKKEAFNLQILLQNTDYGLAQDVDVNVILPDGVFVMEGEEKQHFSSISSGEAKSLDFSLIVNNNYSAQSIPVKVMIKEKFGKFSQNKDIVLNFEQKLSSAKISVSSENYQIAGIQQASLKSDVDRNIPKVKTTKAYRYAIAIGNEDYHSYQEGLSSESDVEFAVNDAEIFSEYCVSALGVEANNLVLLKNATSAKMKKEIDRIIKLASLNGKEAEIIFYYAGHGFPDEKTNESYIIPVDVTGMDVANGIKLSDLYASLSTSGAGRITVFMDACFSGGGRNSGLVKARGVKVTPANENLYDNLVVFSATSSDQTALPYKEKQHGMFTYFLLKKLQESSAECSYSELSSYITENVKYWSIKNNYKDQIPEVNCSVSVQDEWGQWSFRK